MTASRPPQDAAGVNRRVRLDRIRLRPRAAARDKVSLEPAGLPEARKGSKAPSARLLWPWRRGHRNCFGVWSIFGPIDNPSSGGSLSASNLGVQNAEISKGRRNPDSNRHVGSKQALRSAKRTRCVVTSCRIMFRLASLAIAGVAGMSRQLMALAGYQSA